jgi:hypothetical protein
VFSRRVLLVFGFVVARLAWPSVASAKEPLRLEYVDAAGCETSQAFTDAVLALTRLVRAATPGEYARTFRVSLRPYSGDVVHGELSGSAPGGATLRLSARGRCDQVLSALSFAIAFTLDPSARAQPELDALPENPYWARLLALPPEPALPENPYRVQMAEARGKRGEANSEDSTTLPSNPYR